MMTGQAALAGEGPSARGQVTIPDYLCLIGG